jgi:hypothetical protein
MNDFINLILYLLLFLVVIYILRNILIDSKNWFLKFNTNVSILKSIKSVVTTWKFIVFLLGMCSILVFAQFNRYEIIGNYKKNSQALIQRDKLTGQKCLLVDGFEVGCFDSKTYEVILHDKFK